MGFKEDVDGFYSVEVKYDRSHTGIRVLRYGKLLIGNIFILNLRSLRSSEH